MKVMIVGPGAIGLLLYAFLSKSKQEIVLLDKSEERAARLKKNGFRVEGRFCAKYTGVSITTNPMDGSDADLWIICVKAYDTKKVVEAITPHVKMDAMVLSLQNGLGPADLLAEVFGDKRALAGVTQMGAFLKEENIVEFCGEGETIIGRSDGQLSASFREIRELFNKSKVVLRFSKDVTGVIWSKLIINVGINALSAVTRLKNGRLVQLDPARMILSAAVAEAVRVAKRKRVKLIHDDMIAKTESVCEATAQNISSMLADVCHHKKTEIDFLNGAVVRQAQSLGIKTPVNAMLCQLVQTIEGSYEQQQV